MFDYTQQSKKSPFQQAVAKNIF